MDFAKGKGGAGGVKNAKNLVYSTGTSIKKGSRHEIELDRLKEILHDYHHYIIKACNTTALKADVNAQNAARQSLEAEGLGKATFANKDGFLQRTDGCDEPSAHES